MTELSNKEEFIGTIEDLILTEDQIYTNNTFNLKALNETLERLSLINFWNLYQLQRSRLKVERFDIPFNEFLSTTRLSGEKSRAYYPKRYVTYVNYNFIEPELRKKYRNSKYFNYAVNQTEIADNPDLFQYNHLVFIDGDYIFTTEVYPLESKTGIIIDVATVKQPHGISLEKYNQYRESNPIVTVLMVPNFQVTSIKTNPYALADYDYKVPYSSINKSSIFNKDTIVFANSADGFGNHNLSPSVHIDTDNQIVTVDRDIHFVGKDMYLVFFTLSHLFEKKEVRFEDPYFKVTSKMPCPTEQMLVFVKNEFGVYSFNENITVKMYYPNIYEVQGLKENECGIVFIIQDETVVTESEAYFDELAKYQEYIDMLPQYKDGTIPDIIKHYRPSSFVYSIPNYQNSVYVPDTMNYKVQKLHKTIYENPWVLCTYLDLLNLPTEKFYLDMAKIDLSNRIRTDSINESLEPGQPDITFESPHYVFALNRHFVNTRQYDFRIFIDGYFQTVSEYTVLPGLDFYYIYIPVDKVSTNSVIEIERFKLFMYETRVTPVDIDPMIELNLKDIIRSYAYAREVYVVDTETNEYLKRTDYIVEVLYGYAERGQKWVTIEGPRNIVIENKIRIRLRNESYIGKELKVGLQRTCMMTTGDVYTEDDKDEAGGFRYTTITLANTHNSDESTFRVFNNGLLLAPPQYDIELSKVQGEDDIIRTKCRINPGDQFTVDRVAAQYRVCYFQREIDSVEKKGYVDLDGKIPLPLSLKWYDIWLNGRKLNKNNIEILSPTRMYIQGTDSRMNLMITIRDRDPDVFKLPSHDPEFDDIDWNNTVIDDLLDEIGGLREVIANTKDVIDPDNKNNIVTGVVKNLDALIFFYEYLMYTFVNANWHQITQEIKQAFPTLVNENGVLTIEGNVPTDTALDCVLVKILDCNLIGGDDMFTDPNVDYSGIGELNDRFAVKPLNITNYEYALPEEFLCDPDTGEPAIVNDDGTITAISTVVRMRNHIEAFNHNIILNGLGRADVYQVIFDNEFKAKVYTSGTNLLEGEGIETDKPVKKLAIGLDTTFLTQVGDSKMLKLSDIDPKVTVKYTVDDVQYELVSTISRIEQRVIKVDNKVIKIDSIVIDDIPSGHRSMVHSLLIAY